MFARITTPDAPRSAQSPRDLGIFDAQRYLLRMKLGPKGIKIWCALLCAFALAMDVFAQDQTSAPLSEFQIQTQSFPAGVLTAAALSPDGSSVAGVFVNLTGRAPGPFDVTVTVKIWKVGTQDPIVTKQIFAGQDYDAVSDWKPWWGAPYSFAHYCDGGAGIMVVAPRGKFFYLDPHTLDILDATATNIGVRAGRRRAACAANSPRAVLAAYGGPIGNEGYGNGLIRAYDLRSGAVLQEWDMTQSSENFGDVAISPSGNAIAVSHVPINFWGFAKAIQNLTVFDVNTGKAALQVKTGHLPGRISFVGENRVATDDTLLHQPLMPRPTIRLWDSSNGKFIREFGDAANGARRFVGASSDGSVILGYIPTEKLRSGGFSTGLWGETVEQRFRMWDTTTGQTLATSPLLLPIMRAWPIGNLDPSLEVSANGRTVIVFWESPQLFPIDVFSMESPPTISDGRRQLSGDAPGLMPPSNAGLTRNSLPLAIAVAAVDGARVH